ncbi:MAG: hypothetical protein GEU81_04360 [Nitriliruptorales bacterium]|nr:hypothetical protein [Nitriliruptorales bacterium]
MTTYGWRARIGVIKATYRPKNFSYWFDTAPAGVEVVPAAIGFRKGEKRGFLESFERAEELAHTLRDAGCELVIVHGAPPFILRGREFEAQWRETVQASLGIPFLTPMQPHVWALKSLGVKKVLAFTYYGDELNDGLQRYLEEEGIEAVMAGGLRHDDQEEGLYSTPLKTLDRVDFGEFYRYCKASYARLGEEAKSIECFYVNGSGWDAGAAVMPLEQDLKVPVLWPQAMYMWATYSALDICNQREGYGRFIEQWPALTPPRGAAHPSPG